MEVGGRRYSSEEGWLLAPYFRHFPYNKKLQSTCEKHAEGATARQPRFPGLHLTFNRRKLQSTKYGERASATRPLL